MRISKYFHLEDFLRSRTASARGIKNQPPPHIIENLRYLAARLDEIVELFPGVKITINSGYRGPALNKAVGGAKSSQHLLGEAADLNIEGPDDLKIFDAIRMNPKIKFDQLIFEGGGNGSSPWVHISFTRRRAPRRSVLVAVFNKKGKASYGVPNWQPNPYVPKLAASSPTSQSPAPAQPSASRIATTAAPMPVSPALEELEDDSINQPATPVSAEVIRPLSKKEIQHGSPELIEQAKQKIQLLLKAWGTGLASLVAAGAAYYENAKGWIETHQMLLIVGAVFVVLAALVAWYFTHPARQQCECTDTTASNSRRTRHYFED